MAKAGYRRKVFSPESAVGGGILLFGDLVREEFASIRRELRLIAADFGAEVTEVRFLFAEADFTGFLRRQRERPFAAAVFLQSYPGEFPPSLFLAVRTFFPLTPILLVAGDLCEGEGRTGAIEPGVIRLYRRQWKTSGHTELVQYLRERSGRFALPPTATDEDGFLARRPKKPAPDPAADESVVAIPFPGAPRDGDALPAIALISPADPAMGELFAVWFRKKGKRSEFFTIESLLEAASVRSGAPERIVVDALDPEPADAFAAVRRLAETFPQSRIDLLVFAERFSDERLFAPLENVRLVSKPFDPLFF